MFHFPNASPETRFQQGFTGTAFIRLLSAFLLCMATVMNPQEICAQGSQQSTFAALVKQAEEASKLRRHDLSIRLCRQAIKANPQSSSAHALLGWELFSKAQIADALHEEKTALALDGKNAAAHQYLATIYLSQNNLAMAQKELQRATALDPTKRCHCGALEALKNQIARERARKQGSPVPIN